MMGFNIKKALNKILRKSNKESVPEFDFDIANAAYDSFMTKESFAKLVVEAKKRDEFQYLKAIQSRTKNKRIKKKLQKRINSL